MVVVRNVWFKIIILPRRVTFKSLHIFFIRNALFLPNYTLVSALGVTQLSVKTCDGIFLMAFLKEIMCHIGIKNNRLKGNIYNYHLVFLIFSIHVSFE